MCRHFGSNRGNSILAQKFSTPTNLLHPVPIPIFFSFLLLQIMHPRFSFRWLLDELKDTMSRELDFVEEGKNSEKCKKDLAHLKFIYVL